MPESPLTDRGPPPNHMAERLLEERIAKHRSRSHMGADLAVVYAYFPETQTVDVGLLLDPGAGLFRNVPIHGAGGNGLRFIRPLKPIGQYAEPDIGFLIFPRLDSSEALTAFPDDGLSPATVKQPARPRRSVSDLLHAPKGPLFFPGAPVGTQTVPPNISAFPDTTLDVIGIGDAALVDENGYGFILKAGGNPTIVVQDRLNVIKRGQDAGDLKKVGLDGDGALTSLSASGLIRSGPA